MVSMLTILTVLISIMIFVVFLLPLLLALWLWYFHDRHISQLCEELLSIPERINKEFEGRGATRAGVEPHLNAAKRSIEVELNRREGRRQLFLDRAKFISLFKFQ